MTYRELRRMLDTLSGAQMDKEVVLLNEVDSPNQIRLIVEVLKENLFYHPEMLEEGCLSYDAWIYDIEQEVDPDELIVAHERGSLLFYVVNMEPTQKRKGERCEFWFDNPGLKINKADL